MSATQTSYTNRTHLNPRDYSIAWIAPLEIEALAARYMLDERHRGHFPVSRGDDYVFHAGSIGGHNIVIATLPAGQEYGTGSAAALASQVKKFFPNLWFGLLVGVAAGLPDLSRSPARDIRLGDVLVALPDGDTAGLVAYDLGKETEDGFRPLRLGHALATTEPIIRSAIGSIKLDTLNDTETLLQHYEAIRDKEHTVGTFADPGQERDTLYSVRNDGTEVVAERVRRPDAKRTRVWYGPIGSGEKLWKNAKKRNELRDNYGIIGLEMEAAGIMNRIPVGVIRGVCDYGDSHKDKDWQPYAAAMAASYAKAVLYEVPPHDLDKANAPKLPSGPGTAAGGQMRVPGVVESAETVRQSCYYIQLPRNTRFTGRGVILDTLEKIFGREQSRKTALVGLGGVGKTQIALHFAYQVKEKRPEYSIFWVPVLSDASVEQAYVEIAIKLGLQKTRDDENIKELVCRYLSSEEAGRWLLIVDNADDQELVFGAANKPGVEVYLPESENGLILLTTRSRQIAVDLAQSDVIDVEQMDSKDAMQLLEKSLIDKQLLRDKALVNKLLTHLTHLPLAITQAAAYLNQTKAPIQTYLGLLEGAEKDVFRLLGREFRDGTRYQNSQNAIGTTWLVSFNQIEKLDQVAVRLLAFISCIEPKSIPLSILPRAEPEDIEWAIGTLCGYSFLVRGAGNNIFNMHSLVHIATRGWIDEQGRRVQAVTDAISHLAEIFPSNSLPNRGLWRSYLPHAMQLLYQSAKNKAEGFYQLSEGVANCLSSDRRFREATRYYEEVYRWRRDNLSEEDSYRLASEHELASAYLDDRRIKDAIKIFEHVVAVEKETLDEKDHSRLTSEHELASAYLDDRRIKDAIKIFEHVVAVRKETLDEKDHSRLGSEHELARAYLDEGKAELAISLLEHVVTVRKELLAEDDLERLVSIDLLTYAYKRL